MESDWDWPKANIQSKIKLKKEVKKYELWKFWRAICATRIKRKIK